VSWRAYAGPRRPGASRSPIEPPRIAVHGFGEIHRRFVVPLGPHAPKSFRLIGEVDVGVERAQPQRAIRTSRHKFIRRWGDRLKPVLANTDDGPSKDVLLSNGWAERVIPKEQLYDLVFDPNEANNLWKEQLKEPEKKEEGRMKYEELEENNAGY